MKCLEDYKEALGVLSKPKLFSVFEDYESYQLLVLRGVEFSEASVSYVPNAFILEGKEIYQIDMSSQSLSPIKGGMSGLVKLLHNLYVKNRRILDLYLEQVDGLENQIFDRNMTSLFMDHWANLKRDLSRLDSYYFRNLSVYREFFSVREESFGKLGSRFKDIEEMIGYQQSSLNALKSQLDGVHNHYASIKADRMNKTLLGLTVISGIFLPLNLIVGFFGMNTPGLFLMDKADGTIWVLYILGAVIATFLLGFRAVQILDKWILRFFLGRFNIYQNLRDRLDDMSKQLKGQ